MYDPLIQRKVKSITAP